MIGSLQKFTGATVTPIDDKHPWWSAFKSVTDQLCVPPSHSVPGGSRVESGVGECCWEFSCGMAREIGIQERVGVEAQTPGPASAGVGGPRFTGC